MLTSLKRITKHLNLFIGALAAVLQSFLDKRSTRIAKTGFSSRLFDQSPNVISTTITGWCIMIPSQSSIKGPRKSFY
ncbi:Uncharacterized protein HZ326_30553 [Fusarium oxysporum f. sp. albedinis]|nr:Uncharacterized protein HZ326_30553 [Fusarium oxysporum f. sp. albedinis]